jgi:acetyltransferase
MTTSVNPSFPDRSSDVLLTRPHALDIFFKPQSVAIIGATDRPESVGNSILTNLFQSPLKNSGLYPVNPKHSQLLGLKCYPSIQKIPHPTELAIIVTPARTVPELIEECIQCNIQGAIVISAGFKEQGNEGILLEKRIKTIIHNKSFRIIGPNCLGVMNPHSQFNGTFATTIANPGSVAFLSQSGALGTAILDWSFKSNVGFSSFVSIGSMLDLDWGDLIDYLGNDAHTKSIIIYMESIGNANSFLSSAREVALTKPIIVIKAGRTEAAAKAAASHTGSLTVSDAVLRAAFRRCGVLCVEKIEDLFYTAEILSKQPRPRGKKLAIVTNAGGPGVLATDLLIQEGGELAPLSEQTLDKFNQFLSPHWSHSNPIDILGDATPELYLKAVQTALDCESTDGVLVVLTPQAMTHPKEVAEKLSTLSHPSKPLIASFMGGLEIDPIIQFLNQSGIPTYSYPDTAVHLFNYMWKYQFNLSRLYETPISIQENNSRLSYEKVSQKLLKIQKENRTLLTEQESKEILSLYGIPVTPSLLANSPEEAVQAARQIGFPVVLKLNSTTLSHKTDVGGVQLNLKTPEAVEQAFVLIKTTVTQKAGASHFQGVTVQPMIRTEGYELILGSSLDPQFGPIVLFGLGGQLVEVFKDTTLEIPPLNTVLARNMIEQTKIHSALKGVRGRAPIPMEALEKLIVRFCQMIVEQPLLKEVDINPLLASPDQILSLDARMVLHPLTLDPKLLPKPAIRPYPIQYLKSIHSKTNQLITIRPISPEDEPLLIKFHKELSEQSVYQRYFKALNLNQRIAHDRLLRLCFIDYAREMALVAHYCNAQKEDFILGVARLSRSAKPFEREFSVVVSDAWQNQGVGFELLQQLIMIGKQEGLETIVGHILPENIKMQNLVRKLGFELAYSQENNFLKACLFLNTSAKLT